jgi:2'-5' RNA ligase
VTQAPEWTYTHVDQMRDHWWWRPGWDVGKRFYTWHITFDDQPELHRLVDTYQQQLARFPRLDLVPQRWLHLTMQGVGFTHDIVGSNLHELIDHVQTRLGEQPPLQVGFHRPVIRPEAIALPPQPVEPVLNLRRTIREAMATTLGETRVPERAEGFQPHVSLAYSNGSHPSDSILRTLEHTIVEPVNVTIDKVSLIELHRDRRMYEWQTQAVAQLNGTA